MKVEVWDIPTRVFHWLFAGALIFAFSSSFSESSLEWHAIAGMSAFVLAVFRVFWGLFGNEHARFSSFLSGWPEVRNYFRNTFKLRPPAYLGHNPAVGWVVVVMLTLMFVLSATGLVVWSGQEHRGALAGSFSFEVARMAENIHMAAAWTAAAVAVVHVAAALFHDLLLGEGLIVSMITGRKKAHEYAGRSGLGEAKRPGAAWAGWATVVIIAGVALILLKPEGMLANDIEKPMVLSASGAAVPLRENPVYKEECGSCHNAFSPTLLPSASWQRVLKDLGSHFGEDASIPQDSLREVFSYVMSASADRSLTEASRKMLWSMKGRAPLRVTEAPYWKAKHSDISPEVFNRKSVVSRLNCEACHPGASSGSFRDRDITVPKI